LCQFLAAPAYEGLLACAAAAAAQMAGASVSCVGVGAMMTLPTLPMVSLLGDSVCRSVSVALRLNSRTDAQCQTLCSKTPPDCPTNHCHCATLQATTERTLAADVGLPLAEVRAADLQTWPTVGSLAAPGTSFMLQLLPTVAGPCADGAACTAACAARDAELLRQVGARWNATHLAALLAPQLGAPRASALRLGQLARIGAHAATPAPTPAGTGIADRLNLGDKDANTDAGWMDKLGKLGLVVIGACLFVLCTLTNLLFKRRESKAKSEAVARDALEAKLEGLDDDPSAEEQSDEGEEEQLRSCRRCRRAYYSASGRHTCPDCRVAETARQNGGGSRSAAKRERRERREQEKGRREQDRARKKQHRRREKRREQGREQGGAAPQEDGESLLVCLHCTRSFISASGTSRYCPGCRRNIRNCKACAQPFLSVSGSSKRCVECRAQKHADQQRGAPRGRGTPALSPHGGPSSYSSPPALLAGQPAAAAAAAAAAAGEAGAGRGARGGRLQSVMVTPSAAEAAVAAATARLGAAGGGPTAGAGAAPPRSRQQSRMVAASTAADAVALAAVEGIAAALSPMAEAPAAAARRKGSSSSSSSSSSGGSGTAAVPQRKPSRSGTPQRKPSSSHVAGGAPQRKPSSSGGLGGLGGGAGGSAPAEASGMAPASAAATAEASTAAAEAAAASLTIAASYGAGARKTSKFANSNPLMAAFQQKEQRKKRSFGAKSAGAVAASAAAPPPPPPPAAVTAAAAAAEAAVVPEIALTVAEREAISELI